LGQPGVGPAALAVLTDEAKSSPLCCTVASKAILSEDVFAESHLKLLSVPIRTVDVEDDTHIDSYEKFSRRRYYKYFPMLCLFSLRKTFCLNVVGW